MAKELVSRFGDSLQNWEKGSANLIVKRSVSRLHKGLKRKLFIPALGTQRQVDSQFMANLVYTASSTPDRASKYNTITI